MNTFRDCMCGLCELCCVLYAICCMLYAVCCMLYVVWVDMVCGRFFSSLSIVVVEKLFIISLLSPPLPS